MANKTITMIKNLITNPKIRFGYLSRLGLLNYVNDKKYIEREYYLYFHKKINLDNPKTFNEKIQYLKLKDRNRLYTKLVDKYEVKKYVTNMIGEKYIIPTIGVYEKYNDINFDTLPNKFVIKCTHDSGGIVICKNKNDFDYDQAKKTINSYLKRKYFYIHREWPYKNVKPRIIIEKYMKDKKSDELIDYKVLCFSGKAKIIFTCTDRFSDGLKVTFFDTNWERLPFERHYPASNKHINKPKRFKEMLELSEKLSRKIPFVRIDWYEINGKLYFGEYTFYPGAGLEEFTPEEWDSKLGELINIDAIQK